MKRLLLAASLCVVAFVVAPLASASGATFVGACVIKGKATFGEGAGKFTGAKLKTVPEKGTKEQNYEFKSDPNGGVPTTFCAHLNLTEAQKLAAEPSVAAIETAVKEHTTFPAEAEVKGEKAALGCEKSAGGFGKLEPYGETGAPGTGKVKVGGVTAPVEKFKFLGTGTDVHFTVEPTFAAGEATFAEDLEGLSACLSEKEGPKELHFTAVAAGVIG
jgi:hypothetical protein